MSEKKKNQWLYKFSINKEVEVEKKEEQEINGEKVQVTKKVIEKKPVNFAVKRPNGRMHENADMFYGVKLSEGIRGGLLTKALLLKRYRNDGGALSEPDMQYFNELVSKLALIEEEYQKLILNIDKKENSEREKLLTDALNRKKDILNSLQAIESVNQALFAYTAETKAANKLNAWWILYLSYWDENGGDNYSEYFPGDTYEDRIKVWDEKGEQEDVVFEQVASRLNLIVGLWNAGAKTEEDFTNGEKEFGEPLPEKEVTEGT